MTVASIRSSATNTATAIKTITVNKPAGAATGDIIILYLSKDGTDTVGTPSGFTAISELSDNVSSTEQTACYFRVVDGSEGANFTMAWAAGGNEDATAWAICVQDTAGIDVKGGAKTVGNDNTVTVSALTTTVNNTFLLGLCADEDQTCVFSSSSSFSQLGSTISSGVGVTGSASSAWTKAGPATAGSTGAMTWTTNVSQELLAGVIAFKPTAGTTYNDTLGAAITLDATLAAVATMEGARSESLALAMTLAASATFEAGSYSETISLGDTVSPNLVIGSTLSETITMGYSGDATCTMAPGYSETLSPACDFAAVATMEGAIDESITLADTMDGGLVLDDAYNESITLGSSFAASATMEGGYSESLSMACDFDAGNNIGTACSESITLDVDYAAGNIMAAAFSESLSLADDYSDELIEAGGDDTASGGFSYPFPLNVGTLLQRSPVSITMAYNPATQPNLAIWLDTTDISALSLDGSNLCAAATEKSPNGYVFTNAGGAARPKFITNAINAVSSLEYFHNATANNLILADDPGLDYTDFEWMGVGHRKTESASLNERMWGKWTVTGNLREQNVLINTVDQFMGQASANGSTIVNVAAPTTIATGVTAIVGFRYHAATQTLTLSINGVDVQTGSVASILQSASSIFIGSRDSFQEPFRGYLPETMFATALFTDDQRDLNLGYYSNKYGVAI